MEVHGLDLDEASVAVARENVAVIHAVKLVAAEHKSVLEIVVQEVQQVLAHGIRGALVPGGVGKSLFRRENLNEPAAEMVELVTLRDVPVQ